MALHHGGLGNVSSPFSVTRANKICGKPGPLSLVSGCYGLCPDALFTVSVPTLPAAGGGQGAAVPHTGNRTQPWDLPARLCPVPGDGRGQRQANVRWQRPVPPFPRRGTVPSQLESSAQDRRKLPGFPLRPALPRSLPSRCVSRDPSPVRTLRATPSPPSETSASPRTLPQQSGSWLRLPLPPKLRHRC